ncbi:hypothetical protein ACF07Q_28530 [Nocardiopsis dassonvillei]|uniref:hypothetical protein n=1 Tax=Nocardiopsis dassonvillei TaxID=2014 RepID=UPI0036FC0493
MTHAAPTPASTPERDARARALRTLLQGLVVTVLVGAATAVSELASDGGVLTLATVATTAGTGALMAVAAYVQRRLGK